MKPLQLSVHLDSTLSLLGGALVLVGVFFLPMLHGNASSSVTVPVFEWQVEDFFFHYASPAAAALLAFPLVLVLFILVASTASLFRELSPAIVTWRRRAVLAGLIIQGLLGFGMATLYSFALPPHLGAGFALALFGFILMINTNPLRRWSKIKWAILILLFLFFFFQLLYWIAVLQGVIIG